MSVKSDMEMFRTNLKKKKNQVSYYQRLCPLLVRRSADRLFVRSVFHDFLKGKAARLHFQRVTIEAPRWEFMYKRNQETKKRKQELDQESVQENKKTRKKTRTRPRKRPRKKEKNILFFPLITFLVEFLFSYFRVFFYKFSPQK